MSTTACSCGESCVHPVAHRCTSDGVSVVLHSDGAVTGRLGLGLDGVPIVRPRTREARDLALRAGWLFVGEVEVHHYADIGQLYAACRWAAARDGSPGTARARMAKRPALKPAWTVVSTDRDGRPTSRYWRLPRFLGAGTIVWDHVSVGASGGRYEIHHQVGETCVPTGIRFSTIEEVSCFIRDEARAR